MILDFLKKIPFLADLPDEDLRELIETVETVELKKGDILFEEDTEADRTFIIKEGEVEILKFSSGREVLLAVRGSGIVIGEMALLGSVTRTATVRARTNSVLYAISKERFDDLMNTRPSAMQSMFKTYIRRLIENQGQLRQSEKMAQLGTLTAGVAHELNNPAAAIQRGADQLILAIANLEKNYSNIARLGFDRKQLRILDGLGKLAQDQAAAPPELDAMARSDREYEIETWLDQQGIKDAWNIAPNLVNINYGEPELISLANDFPEERLQCVVDWLNATYNSYSLLNEIGQGAQRMSGIVKALKSYSYLDQAPVQSVNINEGINDTLIILHNKLKAGINLTREYDEDLPPVHGYGSELNQVWTNIIDNGVDALEETDNAQITIRTRTEGKWVIVEFEDNGPGIPEDIQGKLFDAFFTTKPPGKGTGLGLNISYGIVVQKHRGDIKLYSKPGETKFEVWLPINFEEE